MARIVANGDRVAICLTGGSSPKQLYRIACDRRLSWPDSLGSRALVHRRRAICPRDRSPQQHGDGAQGLPRSLRAASQYPSDRRPTARIPKEAARRYERELKSFYGADQLDPARPLFDMVLMGVGPDGHTASLFPGYPAVEETERWVVGVPKANVEPFVPRVSLTLPALASCREMLFEVSGAGQARDPDARAGGWREFAGEPRPLATARRSGWWIRPRCRRIFVAMTLKVESLRVDRDGRVRLGQEHRRGRAGRARSAGPTRTATDFIPPAMSPRWRPAIPSPTRTAGPGFSAIADEIDRVCKAGEHVVIACSALKRAYRDVLVHGRRRRPHRLSRRHTRN